MPQDQIIEFADRSLLPQLFGPHNIHLAHIEQKLGIGIADRGHRLTLSGPPERLAQAQSIFDYLTERLKKGHEVGLQDIDAALRFIHAREEGPMQSTPDADQQIVLKTRKKTIVPRSPNQAAYLKAILKGPMVFGLGPAGTGKTYLAVAAAVSLYLEGAVERMVFCRPAVEAGERLGFLPGDMKDKIDPYLRPIYDALHDMLPADYIMNKLEMGDIEIAPLAFMRGRTLSNAFIILDEAQNTTSTQMKMFLTRMGESSRVAVTGDPTQTDLPPGISSGLRDAMDILRPIDEIRFVQFDKSDVTRHPLVGKIIHAYDQKKT